MTHQLIFGLLVVFLLVGSIQIDYVKIFKFAMSYDYLYVIELSNGGQPLLPGKDVADQLKIIFK